MSITLKATLNGHEVLVTLRGVDFASVKAQLEEASQWLRSQAPAQASSPAHHGEGWCHKHNVRVPQDLAVMGFDNIAFGEFSQPPLSTINYDVGAVARMAVDRLMRLIGAGDQLPEPRVTLIDPELIIREST